MNKNSLETLTKQQTNKKENKMKIKQTLAALAILTTSIAAFNSSANALVNVNGYFKSNGTYVMPHVRTNPDGNPYNNFSFRN